VPLKEVFLLEPFSNINLFLRLKLQSISNKIDKLVSQPQETPLNLTILNMRDLSFEKLALELNKKIDSTAGRVTLQ
jgi:hypothetical protein